MTSQDADVRPLGVLALIAAVLGPAMSWTYFFSPLAYLAAVIALPLGLLSLGHQCSRTLGELAIVQSAVAVVATATLLLVEWRGPSAAMSVRGA